MTRDGKLRHYAVVPVSEKKEIIDIVEKQLLQSKPQNQNGPRLGLKRKHLNY